MRIKRSGVYQIINEIDGKSYIGSSKDITNRWKKWRYDFKRKMTYKCRIHAAVNKYGIINFTFCVLEECQSTKEILEKTEQHYIDTLAPEYNIMKKVNINSEEILEKISKSLTKTATLNIFIQKAKEKHGNKYDYSEFDFIDTTTKGKIICPQHGAFEQTPRSHMYGFGCLQCGFIATGNNLRSSLDEFIKKAREIHEDRYDYSDFEYINNKSKGIIICKEHGKFEQSADIHINLKSGCPLCSNAQKGLSKKKNARESFQRKANIIHNNKYDYSLFEYISVHDKSKIICKTHGAFLQKPVKHLSGQGCPKCRYDK